MSDRSSNAGLFATVGTSVILVGGLLIAISIKNGIAWQVLAGVVGIGVLWALLFGVWYMAQAFWDKFHKG